MTGENTSEHLSRQHSRHEGHSRKKEYETRDLISNPGRNPANSNPFMKVGGHNSHRLWRQRPGQRGSCDRDNSRTYENRKYGKPYEHRDNGRERGREDGYNRHQRPGASNQYRDRGGQRSYDERRYERSTSSSRVSSPRAGPSGFCDQESTSRQGTSLARDETPETERNEDVLISNEPGPPRINPTDSHKDLPTIVTIDDVSSSVSSNSPTQGTPPPWPASQWKRAPPSPEELVKSRHFETLASEPMLEHSRSEMGEDLEEGTRVEFQERMKAEFEDRMRAEFEERVRTELEGKIEAELKERMTAEFEEMAKAELEKKVEAQDAERARWEEERAAMISRINFLRNCVTQRDSALKESKRSAEQVGVTALQWETQCRKAEEETKRQGKIIKAKEDKLRYYDNAVSQLRQELEQTTQLLDARTEENKVAQAFMTTADHYSIADITRMVDQLNDEIFQCAMDVSDALTQFRDPPPEYTSEEDEAWKPRFEEACEAISNMWSEYSVARIRAGVEKNDPILFECLAQTLFIYRCREVIQKFCMADQGADWHLRGLWDYILNSHEMPIAKNWLAITNTALKQLSFEDSLVLQRLEDLMIVAGWRPNSKSSTLGESMREKYTEITAKAIKIREVITEGILSAHIEVFCFDMGDTFESQQMQDAYDVSGRGSTARCRDGEILVCTTGLGMRCTTVSKASSSNSTGGERKREVVLKAKVVIQSAIEEP